VGAGTIDQALLGVLPSRHQALRLWGLADRVLIVDEAHSYDPYVNKEMERLIEFHAALGGAVIILSATLASDARQALANAFPRGMACPAPKIESYEYPLLTSVSAKGVPLFVANKKALDRHSVRMRPGPRFHRGLRDRQRTLVKIKPLGLCVGDLITPCAR
jgi:hypothetical protein